MAQTKKAAAKVSTKGTGKDPGKDPFKVKKSKTQPAKEADTVTPPAEVAEAIDRFRECQDQARHFEGEATIYKDKVLAFAQGEYARRLQNGVNGSFKVMGDETMVTYVVTDSSAGLSEEDAAAFAEKWGEEAADELITRDYASIRFDPTVLEANYDDVVEALQALRPEVLENLFKPMLMKAVSGSVAVAKRYAKDPAAMQEIIKDLKIKNYVK
jgi:hypothetical protein